jgi:amino acid adenylation domain-containing protein
MQSTPIASSNRSSHAPNPLHVLHWQQKLQDIDAPTPLPTRLAFESSMPSARSEPVRLIPIIPVIIDQYRTALNARAEEWHVTPASILLAVWISVLHRYSQQSVSLIITNLTAIYLPLAIRFENRLTFGQLVQQITDNLISDRACAIPIDDLIHLLPDQSGAAVHPLQQLMFTVGSTKAHNLDQRPDFALNLEDDQQLNLSYNRDRFTADTSHRLIGHYLTFLKAALTQPETPIDNLPLLTEPERVQLLDNWNATQADYPQMPIYQYFETQVIRTPDAIAVIGEATSITYAELNARSNQLAHCLRQAGVTANVRVGLCLERGIDVMVGLLGILKAGGAYVPIDPDYPQDRIALMLEDAAAPVLLTQTAIAKRLNTGLAKVICLDRDEATIAQASEENLTHVSGLNDLAYILYTSGSTGRPKGVMISQRAFANFLWSMAQAPGITPQDTVLALTSLSFDIAGLETFLPLIVGAKLVMAPRWYATDGQALAHLVEQHDISIMQATPAGWRLLLESGWSGKAGLKIITGGEALLRSLADELLQRCDQLWDIYGPTETTVYSVGGQIKANGQTITIGRPVANTQAYIVDHHMQPVPIGIVGELYLSGDSVADGYLNRPDLTADRFLDNPFGPTKLYRTGDLARYWADGQIEYLGRIDNQVKIRGFRIELGEIESTLEQHPTVRQAIVIPHEAVPGDMRLVAYVVGQTELPVVSQLRSALRQHLPEYMIPAAFMVLSQFPLTPSGKVDRKALPTPVYSLDEGERVPAQDGLEAELVEIWQNLLRLENLGVEDNFFEVGGQSLLAARLADRLSNRFNQTICPAHIFQAPTIAALAQLLRSEVSEAVLPAMMVIQKGAADRTPLFALHVLGERGSYFRALTAHIDPDQPIYGLAAQMLGTNAPPNRVPELAAYYVAQIKAVQPEGPYYLIGLSFGGTVTYEVARQLQVQGDTIGLVGLFDTLGPQMAQVKARRDRLKTHWQNLQTEGLSYIKRKLKSFRQRKRIQAKLFLAQGIGRELSYEMHYQQLLQENLRALATYTYPEFKGELVLFRATEEVFYSKAYLVAGLGWRSLVQQLRIYDVPGNHIGITDEPNVSVLAQFLKLHLPN